MQKGKVTKMLIYCSLILQYTKKKLNQTPGDHRRLYVCSSGQQEAPHFCFPSGHSPMDICPQPHGYMSTT